ncbi:hypothetical protein [Fontivita pretiosa]|uniref:hypothetical protein n=1 Tax=Fontivita pretiosa TaxID=2989684 RepID=UPI003D183CB7
MGDLGLRRLSAVVLGQDSGDLGRSGHACPAGFAGEYRPLVAKLLVCGVGIIAKARFCPSAWCSTSRQRECSLYTIGLVMLRKLKLAPQEAFAAVGDLSESAPPNRGWLRFCRRDISVGV